MTLAEALRTVSHKGPVRYPGAQAQFETAYRVLAPHLTDDERLALFTARSHALDVGEGRDEFDLVMGEIRARLGQVQM